MPTSPREPVEERSRHARVSEAMRAFAEATIDAGALPAAIAEGIAAALDAACGLALVSDDGRLLVPVTACTVAHGTGAEREWAIGMSRSAPLLVDGPHPLAHALATGNTVLFAEITDAQLRARFPRDDDYALASRSRVRHVLHAPMRARGATIGGISLVRFGDAATPFGDDDVLLAQQLADHAGLALTNARLLAQVQRELASRQDLVARQRAVSAVAREFSEATRDHRGLLERVSGRLSELLGGGCVLRLIDEHGAFERRACVHHPDPALAAMARELFAGREQRVGEGFSGRVAATGLPALARVIDSATVAADFEEHCRPDALRLGVRSMIGLPLSVGGEVVGVALLTRHGAGAPFSEDDLRFAEDVAAHAALAIVNARLLAQRQAESERRAQTAARLALLSEASREFAAATGDPEGLLELVTRRIGEIVGEACVVRTVSDDGEAIAPTGSLYHPDPAVVLRARALMAQAPQRRGEGIGGEILATGRPVVFSGTTDEIVTRVSPAFVPLIRLLGVTSFLSAPLVSAGRVIAVITMSRSAGWPDYGDDDVALLTELARHATLALHNSRLLASLTRELAERRRTEASLRQAEEQIRQSQKMQAVGRLAGGVAHDFNNLLSVILSYSSFMLEEMAGDDPRRDDLSEVLRAGERAAELTRQLLAFSRQQVFAPRVLELDAVVAETEKMIRRVVGEDIAVRTRLGAPGAKIKADPGHLAQVVMNLVVNARDAMPTGGVLTIETVAVALDEAFARAHLGVVPGPHALLAVTDTGVGMDHATQQRIFEPFFTTKAPGRGTGLGLSTVFGIVQQSGGTMWVESEPGRGATFRMYLPRTDEQPVPARAEPDAHEHEGGETILLVEDNAQVRALARDILRRGGYDVIEAASGAEALRCCAALARPVALLLTDVVMSHMSGREPADALVAAQPGLRVLFMSGYTDDAILQHRVRADGVALLEKPLRPDTLLRRVREVLVARPR